MLHRGTRRLLQHQPPGSLAIATGCERSLRQERLHREEDFGESAPPRACGGKLCKLVPDPAGSTRGRHPDLRPRQVIRVA